MAELNETETRVENEFDRQEKQLAMDCREIDRLRAICVSTDSIRWI